MADWLSDKQEQKLRLVAWPSPQDYNEAIQNPTSCFQDQELIGLTPQTTALGLPKPATGNFATVYNLSGGGKEFAVRCFLHPLKDESVRYAALSQCLQKHELPNCVRFQFVESGIKVHDEWRPIVKMEWAGGVSLVEHVRQIKSRPNELNQLAENFKQMVLRLSECGIAHGDLQHGNVIVDGDQIKLVDYDAVFVPELDGFTSNELGHPNYQHPQRSAEFFNDKLDRFSAWVIYASLKILSIDSSLWQVLNGGDECLLLRQTDYQNPENSKAFYALETHPESQIQQWSRYIRWLLSQPVGQLPNLDAMIVNPQTLPPVSPPLVSFDSWYESVSLSQTQASGQTASLQPSGSSIVPGASASLPASTASGAIRHSRQRIDLGTILVVLGVLALAGVYYATVLSGKIPAQKQQALLASGVASKRLQQPRSFAKPSQAAYYEALDTDQDSLPALKSDKFKKALELDKSDHGLFDDQRAEALHQIGHWQMSRNEGDQGLAAFQKAYDLNAKTGHKYTNILDDVSLAWRMKGEYLAATDKEFEALKTGLSDGGSDGSTGYFIDGSGQVREIQTLMPACLRQDLKGAMETYAKICGYLEPLPSDSTWSHSAKLDRLKEFVGVLLDEASDQLDKKQIDVAQQLIELSGKAINSNTQLKSLNTLRDGLVRRLSDARNVKRH